MKKLLFAGLAAGILALGAPAAQANHTGYEGGCSFATINDTTPDGQLGGQNQWNGEIDILVVGTVDGAPGGPVHVDCLLKINNGTPTVVASADSPGGGPVAANAAQFTFTADEDDVVTLCTRVTVAGETHADDCGDATTTQIVPQPVIDAIDAVIVVLNQVIDLLNDNVFSQIDPTICPVIGGLAPGVVGVVDITSDGDVYLGGIAPENLFWDCPPYVED